ncbi:YggS family pyridoxal phosphate-dependent enzyme [Ahrensia kielensis]|uniref:YggS family pyridoxal phosphate-dependent enzyme n=1 Tax=Ahrensia kielensis TaxID=76980 RepID=UPI000360AB58
MGKPDVTKANTVSRYNDVCAQIEAAVQATGRESGSAQLVAVSKTYFEDDIEPVIEAGHRVFGENRIQESQQKWPALKDKYSDIELHLIGPLQSNKAGEAVALFDVIETVDREKIANALAGEMRKQDRYLDVYVQVNTGMEEQKAGIAPQQTSSFVSFCRDDLKLNVIGLMCIPPADENPGPHFALLRKLARENNLDKLSMGMSGDFETAIEFGATSVRVGSAIFGSRA